MTSRNTLHRRARSGASRRPRISCGGISSRRSLPTGGWIAPGGARGAREQVLALTGSAAPGCSAGSGAALRTVAGHGGAALLDSTWPGWVQTSCLLVVCLLPGPGTGRRTVGRWRPIGFPLK